MAAKGNKAEKLITWEQILEASNGGFDLLRNEIGKFPIGKAFKHPFKKDNTPSGAIVCNGGIWFLIDFAGTFPTMTALQFIQKKYSLDYKEALDKMAIDLGLKKRGNIYTPIEIAWTAPIETEERELHIGFSARKWRKEHIAFWENTEVTEPHCRKYETYAVKDLAINRRRVAIGENEVVWAYYVPESGKVKIYFPEREGKAKHRGNVENSWIWNIDNIEECDKLIVQKSMKDLLVTAVITPCVVAVQNESAKRFMNAATADKLRELAPEIFLAFGSDEHGKTNSILLSKEYGFKWVNVPNKYLEEGINDSYALSHKYGIEEWKKCLKNKKIIQ